MTSNLQYTARTGMNNISVANPNLNGSGAVVSIITGQLDGTQITSLMIKATGTTTQGMVRLYINKAGTGVNSLIKEVFVPAITQTAVTPAFAASVPINLTLALGDQITASTQNTESFNVIAFGRDGKNCNCLP